MGCKWHGAQHAKKSPLQLDFVIEEAKGIKRMLPAGSGFHTHMMAQVRMETIRTFVEGEGNHEVLTAVLKDSKWRTHIGPSRWRFHGRLLRAPHQHYFLRRGGQAKVGRT